MKKSSALTAAAIVLIAGTALFLANLKSIQRLGVPGVRVIDEPSYSEKGDLVNSNSVYLPEKVLDYRSEKTPVATVVLGWLPKDTTYGQRIYQAPDGFELAMNVVLMGSDRTSIHKPQFCLTGIGWHIDEYQPDRIQILQPHSYELPVMRITSSRTVQFKDGSSRPLRSLFVYWFVADDQLTADHGERMWWMSRDMIVSGVLQRWAYVSCFAMCAPGAEQATYDRMKEMISAAVPQFQLAAGESKLAQLP